jgi:CheY-like chemotaxis protein
MLALDKPARILVVEDFFLVAQVCRQVLERRGYGVVGPVASVDQALGVLEQADPGVDGAVLDLSLKGEAVTPVAERLEALGIPFVFLTAAADLTLLPAAMRALPKVEKPMTENELIAALSSVGLHPASAPISRL